jgi:hypothetical protein
VKKRGMTGAELAEKAAKKPKAQLAVPTGQSHAAAPPTNVTSEREVAAEGAKEGQRRSSRGRQRPAGFYKASSRGGG